MPSPDQSLTVQTLQNIISLGRNTGATDAVLPLDQWVNDLQKTKPTYKLLRSAVTPLTDCAYLSIEEKVYDRSSFKARPGMEKHLAEFRQVFRAWSDVVYPPDPQPSKLDGSKFSGASQLKEKMIPYWGKPEAVRPIVERTIDLLQRYTAAVGAGEFEKAYSMTANGLQAWMTKKRFVTEHEKAARQYGGPAIEYRIDSFQVVYADESSRQKIKSDDGWPKTTSKEDRRSCVIGFWIRDKKTDTGCWGGFLFSEENKEYRIASFNFFAP